jgi:hypothetical protein
VLANLSDLLFSDPNLKAQIFRVSLVFNNDGIVVPFPKAFKAGTIPYVFVPSYQETSGGLWYSFISIAWGGKNGTTSVTNESVMLVKTGWGGGTAFAGNTGSVTVDIFALGYFDNDQ